LILVDTSVWIATFRLHRPLDLARLLDLDEVVTWLPVIQEVRQGFRDEAAFRRAQDAMFALPIVESPLGEEVFSNAVDFYRRARRRGLTVWTDSCSVQKVQLPSRRAIAADRATALAPPFAEAGSSCCEALITRLRSAPRISKASKTNASD
jgi:predicted nucleic acid-binding protein